MKRNFTHENSMKKIVYAVLALLLVSMNGFAAGQGYYDYFVELSAYPSGAGLVYASTSTNELSPDNPDYTDFKTPAEKVDVKYYAQTASYGFNAYAVPADGWILAGFSSATKNADEELEFNDVVRYTDNPSYISNSSKNNYDDEQAAISSFPMVADSAFYALFTHVAPRVALGQADLGTVLSSKVCNEIGDEVYLTATPTDEQHTKFDYWVNKNTGEKLTDNPLKINVSGTAYYEAHFLCDSAIYITFPEEGGKKIFYSDSTVYLPDNVHFLDFAYSSWTGDSLLLDKETGKSYWPADTIGYTVTGKKPCILYGKGEATIIRSGEEVGENTKTFIYSGAEGMAIDTMAVTMHYYTINLDKEQFELMPAGTIVKPNTAFWALDNARYTALGLTAAPEVIYWNDPSGSTGIEGVKADKVAAKAKKGIYTIAGQKVDKMTAKGLYVKDGEKVLYLGK